MISIDTVTTVILKGAKNVITFVSLLFLIFNLVSITLFKTMVSFKQSFVFYFRSLLTNGGMFKDTTC